MQKSEWNEIIQKCVADYAILKQNGSNIVPRNFIRAWMQTNYDIFKLSGYFYRMFNALVERNDLNESSDKGGTSVEDLEDDEQRVQDGAYYQSLPDTFSIDMFKEMMNDYIEKLSERTKSLNNGFKFHAAYPRFREKSYTAMGQKKTWQSIEYEFDFRYEKNKFKKNGDIIGTNYGNFSIYVYNSLNAPEKFRMNIAISRPDKFGSWNNVDGIFIQRTEISGKKVLLFQSDNFSGSGSSIFTLDKEHVFTIFNILDFVINALPVVGAVINDPKTLMRNVTENARMTLMELGKKVYLENFDGLN